MTQYSVKQKLLDKILAETFQMDEQTQTKEPLSEDFF